MAKTVLLLDGTAIIYRSYFAFIRNPLTNSKGEETSAVFGTVSATIRLLRDLEPDYVAFVLDSKGKTFRHEMYEQYKATRPPMPDSLREQFPRVIEIMEAMDIPVLQHEGVEADDLIGTLATRACGDELETVIYSGDKDFLQLVRKGVTVIAPGRDSDIKYVTDKDVEKKLGVSAAQVIDLLALMGDSSDNVPGVRGVGPKTAIKILGEHGSLDGIYEHAESFKGKMGERIRDDKANAYLSQELVTIKTDVPVEAGWNDLERRPFNVEKAAPVFRDLEFHRLLEEIGEPPEAIETDYVLVSGTTALKAMGAELAKAKRFAFDTETTSTNPVQARLVGISFSTAEGNGWYVPVAHAGEGNLSIEEVREVVGPLLADQKISKVAQNAKYDLIVLESAGFEIAGDIFDPMVVSYVLDPGQRSHGPDYLATVHLNHKPIPISDLIGTGKNQKSMDELLPSEVCEYACEDADLTLRLADVLEPMLEENELEKLCAELEFPLIGVLKRMEQAGVSIDIPFLAEMSEDLRGGLEERETRIHELAGREFNINSPMQLREILFDEIGLKPRKKTKTGYSTDTDVLQELAKEHPLPAEILEYRQINKLLGTYVDALPKMVNPETGKIHTSFNQTVAATGRLSTSDPGLQNIPIRTELGRQIRKAFLPSEKGWSILSLDYSQIELRLLAHLAEDDGMIADFRSGADIHSRTAATLFGLSESEVTGEMRSRAKAVNFGIVYGMGAFGLATRLDIPRADAQRFITEYFRAYPGVQEWIDHTIEVGKELGYVETMLGRRRYLADLNSSNGRLRSFAERTAVNTPIQGSAADLIKLAMVAVDEALRESKLRTRMILQVHDELVFDTPGEEVDEVTELVKRLMESQFDLRVPLVVDAGAGANWLEAHGLEGGS